MINIIRVGRERLKEAYEIVNKVDQGMNVPEWFVAEPYEEFDFWMREERGLLYLAVDEDENVRAVHRRLHRRGRDSGSNFAGTAS